MAEPVTASRRWRTAALGVAAALLFGYVLTHRVESPAVGAGTRPPPLAAIDGERGTGPQGLRILLGGASPALIDAYTGTADPVPGLRVERGEQAQLVPRLGGVLATVAGDRRSRALLLNDGAVTELGDAVRVTALLDGGVALTTQGNGLTQVRVRGPDGTAVATWSVRGIGLPVLDTAAGLLVSRILRTGSSGDELVLLDPRTGAERRELGVGQVLGATERQVVTLEPGCRDRCRLTLTDVITGEARKLPPLTGRAPVAGALSGDGELLALSVPGDPVAAADTQRSGSVVVVDLVGDRTTVLPGVRTAPSAPAAVAWSPDGTVLVVAVSRGEQVLVGLWSPARPERAPVVLPVELGGPAGSLATLTG